MSRKRARDLHDDMMQNDEAYVREYTAPHLALGTARHHAPTARVGESEVQLIRVLTVSSGPGQLEISTVRELSIRASIMGNSP